MRFEELLVRNVVSRFSKNRPISPEVADEAVRIARGTKQPGQTKEQTRLVVKGIRKGIEQYKKQQKTKARELDKKLKSVARQQSLVASGKTADPATRDPDSISTIPGSARSWLPWILLGMTWMGIAIYLIFQP